MWMCRRYFHLRFLRLHQFLESTPQSCDRVKIPPDTIHLLQLSIQHVALRKEVLEALQRQTR